MYFLNFVRYEDNYLPPLYTKTKESMMKELKIKSYQVTIDDILIERDGQCFTILDSVPTGIIKVQVIDSTGCSSITEYRVLADDKLKINLPDNFNSFVNIMYKV